jgi:putative DNA-invertase from lambdoid prophage Rac
MLQLFFEKEKKGKNAKIAPEDCKVYAYFRGSTDKIVKDNQKYEIEQWCIQKGINVDFFVEETISGAKHHTERQLSGLLKEMSPGDTLIVSELSRIARDLMNLMEILSFAMLKEIQIKTVKDNYEFKNDLKSKVLAFAFGLAAEVERQMISERTKIALARRKSQGIKLGRKPKPKVDILVKEKVRCESKAILSLIEKSTLKGITKKIVDNKDKKVVTKPIITKIKKLEPIKEDSIWENVNDNEVFSKIQEIKGSNTKDIEGNVDIKATENNTEYKELEQTRRITPTLLVHSAFTHPKIDKSLLEEQRFEVAQCVRDGMKIAEIAQKYRVHYNTVIHLLSRQDIYKDNDDFQTHCFGQKAIRLYQSGKTIRQIEQILGIGDSTITRYLKKNISYEGKKTVVELHGEAIRIDYVANKMPVSRIATKYGTATKYIKAYLVQLGVWEPPKKKVEVYATEILEAHQEGISPYLIGKKFGCTTETIIAFLGTQGIIVEKKVMPNLKVPNNKGSAKLKGKDDYIKNALIQNNSLRQIALALDVSYVTLSNYIKSNDLYAGNYKPQNKKQNGATAFHQTKKEN